MNYKTGLLVAQRYRLEEVIATGGIDAANTAAFLEAGAAAVGIGGALTRADREARRAIVRAVAGAGAS